MFVRTISSISCAVAVLAAASMVQAQTFKSNHPTLPTTFTVADSEFFVEQTQQLSCDITGFTGAVDPGGTGGEVNVGPTLQGPGLCTFVGLNTDWVLTPIGGQDVLVSNISAASLAGTCDGAVIGVFRPAPSTIMDIASQSIPGTVNTLGGPIPMDCWIEGFVDFGTVTLSTP